MVCLHPLPTHGGMMDSHLYRKAAWRLPALAGIAVLRFNTRGTTSAAGTSEGAFDDARGRGPRPARRGRRGRRARGLPDPWLVGWSFGTDVVLRHGDIDPVRGRGPALAAAAVLARDADLDRWAASGRPLTALVPELDDYLRPDEARERFARVPQAEVVGVEGAKHLWVGEKYVRIVLDAIVAHLVPGSAPLPDDVRRTDGEVERPVSTFRLDGRTALVTGASRGIGRAIATAYAEAGADVALLARDAAKLAEVAADGRGAGRRAVVLPCDVTDIEAVQARGRPRRRRARARRHPGEQRRRQLVLDAAGRHALLRLGEDDAAQPRLGRARHPGAAARTCSSARAASSSTSRRSPGLRGAPMMSHYGAAKAALLSLTQSLALETAWAGIRVNALVPGWIETDLTDFLRANEDAEKGTLSRVPMARWGPRRGDRRHRRCSSPSTRRRS